MLNISLFKLVENQIKFNCYVPSGILKGTMAITRDLI